jgi:hypothetical protein
MIYLIIKSDTKQVYTVSAKDDTAVPEGYEKMGLPTLAMEDIPKDVCHHKYDGGFISSPIPVAPVDNLEELIKEKQRQLAIEALKAEGKLDKDGKLKKAGD